MTVTVHQVVKLPTQRSDTTQTQPQSATQYGFDTGQKRTANRTSVNIRYANVGLN